MNSKDLLLRYDIYNYETFPISGNYRTLLHHYHSQNDFYISKAIIQFQDGVNQVVMFPS